MTTADGQRGQILPLFALLLALLLLPVAALAVDGGLLLSTHANLVATTQSAAESGAQAVDVTALDRTGSFQLCGAPDGNPTCGNGVGDVAAVVAEVVDAGTAGPGLTCRQVAAVDLAPVPGQRTGCELALLGGCPVGSSVWTGVSVLLWKTSQMPLLGLGDWSSILIQGRATAWMTHGFGRPVPTGSATC
ncbi:MAG: pilus assembly protein TadG-related protein [Candidatus Dormibacteria bacterium]